jgi:rare lipoprotein A
MLTRMILYGAVMMTFACSTAEEPLPRPPEGEARESAEIEVLESREGHATYVARALDGKQTASGEAFDMAALVAAHPNYPFGTLVRVTNVENGRTAEVRVVDRGPVRAARQEGVIIDLSRAAADALGFVKDGRAKVRLDVLRWGESR